MFMWSVGALFFVGRGSLRRSLDHLSSSRVQGTWNLRPESPKVSPETVDKTIDTVIYMASHINIYIYVCNSCV